MEEQKDTYLTVSIKSNGIFKDKGSKFIAHAYPVNNIDTIKTILEELKKEFYDARHICYAYRLGAAGEEYRLNDDGEPSGTAGKPIYGQLLSHNLTNILVTVVRYFGGTKLGVSGLIQAYKSAAADAIAQNTIEERIVYKTLKASFDYPEMNSIMQVVKNHNLMVLSQDFRIQCSLHLAIRKNDFEGIFEQLSAIPKVKVEEA